MSSLLANEFVPSDDHAATREGVRFVVTRAGSASRCRRSTAAAGTASPLWGALALGAFCLGTMPSLIVVGVAGHFAGHRLNASAVRFAPVIMAINAVMLGAIGLHRLAPFLP